MARIRTIKPKFWDDSKVGRLARDIRLLYIGLWTFADDRGFLIADPAWVKSKVFPFDNIQIQQVERWIGVLEKEGFLCYVEYRAERFIYLPKFLRHQKIDKPNEEELCIPKDLIDNVLQQIVDQSSINRRTIVEQSPPIVVEEEEKELEEDKESINTTHTVLIYPKKRVRVCDVETAYQRLTQSWIKGYAPSLLKFKRPLSRKQFHLLLRGYEFGDIVRILFDISNKHECCEKYDSVYAAFAKFAECDKRLQEQREAIAYNGSLSQEAVVRGTVQRKPVPRVTSTTHPLLGDIVDAL